MGIFQSKPAARADGKVYCNVYNQKEIKFHCDDVLEQILTRKREVTKLEDKNTSTVSFRPFAASHLLDDALLFLQFAASITMLASVGYVYMKKVSWNDSKSIFLISVSIFFSAYVLVTLANYIRGPIVFSGVRKTTEQPSELECILIKSPYMKGPTKSVERTKEGLSVLTPPSYELDVNYMRLGSDSRTVRAKRKGRIIVGHHGEWFTHEGEFLPNEFESRFLSSLQKHMGA